MAEVWLRGNRRLVTANALVAAVVAGIAGALAGGLLGDWPPSWLRVTAGLIAVLSFVWLLSLFYQWRQPRLARSGNELLVYMRRGGPIRVPLDVVECFLMGHASSYLKGPHAERSHATTLVVRLAEKAEAWQHVDVEPALGNWCDGHIVFRGTWCEPLSLDLVQRLNKRLTEAQREAKREIAS